MRRIALAVTSAVVVCFASGPLSAECTRIKDGTLTDKAGRSLALGYDAWGYNYQAHMFNGFYENYTRPETPVTEGLVKLSMKWSDDWLANVDCDGDGRLDRGGLTGESKGWLTNHEEGEYLGTDNELHHYSYFVKIVYVGPANGDPDPWADKRIWGSFAVIEEVWNDPDAGLHGADRSRLVNPAGLGVWTN